MTKDSHVEIYEILLKSQKSYSEMFKWAKDIHRHYTRSYMNR